MASRIGSHDAQHGAAVDGDPKLNQDQDIMKPLRNNFLPETFTPHFLPDNPGSTINRFVLCIFVKNEF